MSIKDKKTVPSAIGTDKKKGDRILEDDSE